MGGPRRSRAGTPESVHHCRKARVDSGERSLSDDTGAHVVVVGVQTCGAPRAVTAVGPLRPDPVPLTPAVTRHGRTPDESRRHVSPQRSHPSVSVRLGSLVRTLSPVTPGRAGRAVWVPKIPLGRRSLPDLIRSLRRTHFSRVGQGCKTRHPSPTVVHRDDREVRCLAPRHRFPENRGATGVHSEVPHRVRSTRFQTVLVLPQEVPTQRGLSDLCHSVRACGPTRVRTRGRRLTSLSATETVPTKFI